jgi:predicted ATPase
MAALDWITVKGFKSIASVEKLELRPINVLIGPNGSGKSNFIGLFAFLQAIREGQLQDYVLRNGGADKLLHFGSKITSSMHVHISFDSETNQYSIDLQPTASDELVPQKESALFWNKERYSQPYSERLPTAGREAGISIAKQSTRVGGYVRRHLERWRLYHFHDTSSTSPMKKTADVNDNRYFRADGSNVAPFLFFLREKYPDSYRLIQHTVQKVAPFLEDFLLEPQRLNVDKIKLEWKHKGVDAYYDASSLSDGTLRFIALATLFLQPKIYRPSIILVDEPELGLHPYAIAMLASLIKTAATETQVIVSTQSPLLLDHFDPEDVLVADRVNGGTRFTRLNAGPLEQWKDEYSLGQLWEKNEIGGRPAVEKAK